MIHLRASRGQRGLAPQAIVLEDSDCIGTIQTQIWVNTLKIRSCFPIWTIRCYSFPSFVTKSSVMSRPKL